MIKQFGAYEKAAGIYKIVNKVNGKIYIGQSLNFRKRAGQHERELEKNKHKNMRLQRSWNEYGSEAFEFTVLCVIDNPEKRTYIEQKLIDAFYGENCYNLEKKAQLRPEDVREKIGRGNLGKTVSEATKQKLREAGLGKTHSEVVKQKMSKAKRGKPSPKKGIPMSEASKQKMSEAKRGKPAHNKGKPHSEETKQKIRQAKLGKTLTEEHRQKISEAGVRRYASSQNLSPIAPESSTVPENDLNQSE